MVNKSPVIWIVSDLPGTGCVPCDDSSWLKAGGSHYEEARFLAAEEVNAASRGCMDGGFHTVVLLDLYVHLNASMLDRRLYVYQGMPTEDLLEELTPQAALFTGWNSITCYRTIHRLLRIKKIPIGFLSGNQEIFDALPKRLVKIPTCRGRLSYPRKKSVERIYDTAKQLAVQLKLVTF